MLNSNNKKNSKNIKLNYSQKYIKNFNQIKKEKFKINFLNSEKNFLTSFTNHNITFIKIPKVPKKLISIHIENNNKENNSNNKNNSNNNTNYTRAYSIDFDNSSNINNNINHKSNASENNILTVNNYKEKLNLLKKRTENLINNLLDK